MRKVKIAAIAVAALMTICCICLISFAAVTGQLTPSQTIIIQAGKGLDITFDELEENTVIEAGDSATATAYLRSNGDIKLNVKYELVKVEMKKTIDNDFVDVTENKYFTMTTSGGDVLEAEEIAVQFTFSFTDSFDVTDASLMGASFRITVRAMAAKAE